MKRQRIGHSMALAGIICIVGGFDPAVAQEDAPGGTILTFGIETRLSVNDNYALDISSPGTSVILDTALSFGYLAETATERFAFDIDGVLRASELPVVGGDFRFDDPRAAISYDREGANSRLTATATYSDVNLDFIDPFEFIEDGDLITGSGRRASGFVRVIFETGTSGPLGFGIELERRDVNYTDTTDLSLYDTQTDEVALTSRFQLSPVIEGRVRLSQEDYSAEDLLSTDRTSRALSFGATYEISPVTTLDATLGFEKIDDSVDGYDDGSIGSLSATRALANGSAGIVLDRTFDTEGGRTTLSVNRDLELPSGRLAFSLGVTKGELGGNNIVGSIDYAQTLPKGELTVLVERSVDSDSTGDEVLTTTAAVGYSMPATAVSTLSFDFDFDAIDEVGSGSTLSSDRGTFTAAYTHELTADWDLSAGYEYQREFTEDSGTASSNEIFMTLGREFSIRK